MTADLDSPMPGHAVPKGGPFRAPHWLADAPVPLLPLQPLLDRIVRSIARRRPGIFARIGPHTGKCFLIDPVDLPFVLLLRPDPANPGLRAARRRSAGGFDARIAGRVAILFDVIDGRMDGDALFFTRDLVVEGDTEAAVCLRNALDDLEGSIAGDVADLFGPPGRAALAVLRRLGGRDRSAA